MTAGVLTRSYCYGDCLCFDRVGVILTADVLTDCYGDCQCFTVVLR